jgi:hypothetical protein
MIDLRAFGASNSHIVFIKTIMASKVGTRIVNIMGVLINKDGTMDEFVVPRSSIKLNTFNPSCLDSVC